MEGKVIRFTEGPIAHCCYCVFIDTQDPAPHIGVSHDQHLCAEHMGVYTADKMAHMFSVLDKYEAFKKEVSSAQESLDFSDSKTTEEMEASEDKEEIPS